MKTNRITISDLSKAESAIKKAAEVVLDGGLVAFPTETVYGLAARVDLAGTAERLAKLKERPVNKPFTVHIGRKGQLGRYVPWVSPLDRALLRRAWPGPLTAVFSFGPEQMEEIRQSWSEQEFNALYHEQSIGVRLPDHEVARGLLGAVDAPVVAPSANLAGARPPSCAEDVLEQLDGRIDLVLDAGSTRYSQASTVIRLQNGSMEMLRQGVLDAGAIERMRQVTIMFVCTGNTCRSPMAEGIGRQQLAARLGCSVDDLGRMGYKIVSTGAMAFAEARAAEEAVEACREMGVDISSHRARALTVELINGADYVFVMSRSHRRAVLRLVSGAESRTALLAGEREIADPVGRSVEVYRDCAAEIAAGVADSLEEIFAAAAM